MEKTCADIFLYPDSAGDLALLSNPEVKQAVQVFMRSKFFESANVDSSFNDNKFFGAIALAVALNRSLVVVSAATSLLAKKGGLALTFHLAKKIGLKNPTFHFLARPDGIFVNDEQLEREAALLKCCHDSISFDAFYKMAESFVLPSGLSGPLIGNVKVTCGFRTRHTEKKTEKHDASTVHLTGHVTRGFGLSYQESEILREQLQLATTEETEGTEGEIFTLFLLDPKTGEKSAAGSIVSVPALDSSSSSNPKGQSFSHITVNTSIKSVLSGAVLKMWFSGKSQFPLSEIDDKDKSNKIVHVEPAEKTKVEITGWYVYAI